MFESLKSKMKSLFSKADKHLDEEKVYKPEEPEQKPPAPEPAPEVTRTEETTSPVKDVPAAEEPVRTPEPEPTPAPAPVEEPKLSRKEMLKLKKQEKKEAKRAPEAPSSSVVSDSGKKIKEDPLDEILDELEIILLEADVAYPVGWSRSWRCPSRTP